MSEKNKTKAQLIEEMAALRERNAELESQQAEHQRTEQVQSALYRIADTASAVEDMQEFYATIHQIVSGLVVADNFYITLYDETRQLMNTPYAVDSANPDRGSDPLKWKPLSNSTTSYVLRTGQFVDIEKVDELIKQGEIEYRGIKSVDGMGIPLKAEGRTIGMLAIQGYTEDTHYTQQDKKLLNFVAQHIATALERARLLDDTRQRNAELAIINSVGEGLVKQLEFQAIIDLVGDKIRDIFAVHTIFIALYDKETNLIRFPYSVEGGRRMEHGAISFGEGLTSHVIRSGEPLVITEDAERRYAELGAVNVFEEEEPKKSWLGMPILMGKAVTGVICLQDVNENAFSEGDVRLLSTLAANMGVALENARLFDETTRLLAESEEQVAELSTLNIISEGLVGQLDLQSVIDLVGDRILEVFDTQFFQIVLYDPDIKMFSFPYLFDGGQRIYVDDFRLPHDQGLSSIILRSGQPLALNTLQEIADREIVIVPEHLQPPPTECSWLGVPIMIGRDVTGIIAAVRYQDHAFSPADMRLLTTIAANMGVAIENARLFERIQQTNQELSQTLEELRTTQGQLVEAEKMAALGGLVAGVAHEINTPVGVGVTAASTLQDKTSGFSEIYKSGQMKRSDLEKYLNIAEQSSAMILRNLERAAELIQSFKQVAVDQSSEERRKFPVKAYLEEILLSLRPKLKKTQLTIEVNGDDSLTLDSYPGAFSQIVTNLIMNSLLHAYGPDESGQLTFDFNQRDGYVIFEYNDDGKGIPAENLSKIFEPFFTTKRTQGGSGLGLHIIYNLVTQRLGGTINCESKVGNGTKFIIEVPISTI